MYSERVNMYIWRSISSLNLKFMQEILSIIEQLGFNHHESALYMHLLYHGETAASKLASTLKMPRSTVRGILDRLTESGIIGKVYKQNTQYYFCHPPVSLEKYVNERIQARQKQLEKVIQMIPLLEGIHEKKGVIPKVQVFEGKKQVIEAFNLSLFDEGTKELLIFTSYEFLKDPLIRENDDDFFIKMRIQKGISARVLVGKTDESGKMQKKNPGELRERRFIPEKYQLPGNIHIYGNSVMYFTASNDEYLAVLIQSNMIADTMRALFEFMWEQCDE